MTKIEPMLIQTEARQSGEAHVLMHYVCIIGPVGLKQVVP